MEMKTPLRLRLMPKIRTEHPHHRTIDATLACEICGRRLAEAREALKRLPPVGR